MRILLALAALALAAPGCGSASVAELPPPAGPAASPPLGRAPAGRVVPARGTGRAAVPRAEAGGRVFVAHGDTVTVRPDGRPLRPASPPTGLAAVEDGRQVAVVAARARTVETFDARTLARLGRVPAGVGPTGVASNGRQLLFVADTAGDGLLVLHTRPELEVFRRVAFPGGAPYAVAFDPVRERIWVTLTGTNEVAELNAGTRPGVLHRYPSVRRPRAVDVDPATGRVVVTGDGGRQTFAPAR